MNAPARIGLVLLAAGGSSRLGRPKQLLAYRGQPLLRRAAETALASRCRPVVVVLGAGAEACAAALEGLPVQIAINSAWSEGLATSLHAGLAAMERTAPAPAGVVVCVADQPLLTPALVDALLERQRATGVRMAAAEYSGRLGVPALFMAELFERLQALRGDQGARELLRAHPSAVARVPFPEGAVDVDTAADFAALRGTTA